MTDKDLVNDVNKSIMLVSFNLQQMTLFIQKLY